MKAISIAVAASLAFTGSAQPHNHARHHHPAKREEPSRVLLERDVTTAIVVETTNVYVLAGGGQLSIEEAEQCLADGSCVIVGSTNPQTSAQNTPGVFMEEDTETSSSSSTRTSSTPSTTATSAAATSVAAGSSMTDTSDVDTEFPDDVYDCATLPGGFGAVSADYLGMSGWLGIQWGWSNIVTGVKGDTCTSGAHCTYLCPEGYEKAQWPERQGDDGESIGGLYCNSNGKLEKTRAGVNTLCQKGQGGVTVTSSLTETVYMCRTDYPGTEAMLIPIEVAPGTTHDVTNPLQTEYLWQGKKTSAQYYVNNLGLTRDQACTWDSDAVNIKSAGDKAPSNFGTGVDGGTTYFSIFPNSAVSSAVLDYNIKISVDGVETCSLVDGVYSGGSSGCTGASSGGNVKIEFY